jgi:uncharacterized protein (DUF362 family)
MIASAVHRRSFLHLAAATPLLARENQLPQYRIVTRYPARPGVGMPEPYRARVVRVHSEGSIDPVSEKIDEGKVREMLSRGMRSLTGESSDAAAWSRFITPKDVVGIKVNCSGAPRVMSNPEVVGGIVANLTAIGVPPEQIYIYERFADQVKTVGYDKHVPAGVHFDTAENGRGSILGYDPYTYVEVDFFGEEDTRSYLTRLVSAKFTKIINVPNMKEHQAAGVTGCLKNIGYGDFSNVARSHRYAKTNTYSFIGTLASVEPLRSRTVLHIMDGLRGVWHAGPFSRSKKFRFFPKQIMFGTDPVAMDRLLIDVIEAKRKAEGAPSIFDRSPSRIREDDTPQRDPAYNHFVREPGHVEYASTLGLGEYDIKKIKVIEL